MAFESLSDRLNGVFKRLRGKGKLTEADIKAAMREVRMALLEADVEIRAGDFHLRDMCGPGYAIPSEAGNAAVRLLAAREGLFLDPVYTGKAWTGMLKLLEEGWFGSEGDIVFVHTGGAAALFAIDLPH